MLVLSSMLLPTYYFYAQNYVHDYDGIIGLIKPSSNLCASYSPIYVSQSFANEINFEDGHL